MAANGQLGDWLQEVPETVQDAADAYDKAHTAKSKADGRGSWRPESKNAIRKPSLPWDAFLAEIAEQHLEEKAC